MRAVGRTSRRTSVSVFSSNHSMLSCSNSYGLQASYCSGTTSESTFSLQNKLPRLPIPTLSQTTSKWLKTVRPFLNDADYAHTIEIVNDFERAGGVGETLQARLQQRDKNEKYSWLERWWLAYAYMTYREPVPINVSFFFKFDDSPQKDISQFERTGNLTSLFLNYKSLIDREILPVEKMRGVPQCMIAYERLFNTCRIPKEEEDILENFDKTQNRNLIVISKNKFYTFDVIDEKTGKVKYNSNEFAQIFQAVKSQSERDSQEEPWSILTSENRTTWCKFREEFLQIPGNAETLKVVEKACFVVCLDDLAPSEENDICKLLLHGGGVSKSSANRFFDKPLQLVTFANARAGLVGEHSGIDGMPVMNMVEYVLENERKTIKIDENLNQKFNTSEIQKLNWNLNDSLKTKINTAIQYAQKNIDNLEMQTLNFTDFGKNEIKKWKVGPDAVAQLAMQRTYFRLHGKFPPTYESASTRQYARGRTETGRSVSIDSTNWVKAMNLGSAVPTEEKRNLFRKAATSHSTYLKEASEGFGVDRHILGLKLIGQEAGITHQLFDSKAWKESSYWNLSTSQLPTTYSTVGYGAVVPDGYGVWYGIRDDHLVFTVSAYHSCPDTSAKRFLETLKLTLREIKAMFADEHQTSKL